MNTMKYNNNNNNHHRRWKDIILHRVSNDVMLQASLAVNLFFLLTWVWSNLTLNNNNNNNKSSLSMIRGEERTWHGGHPMAQDHKGSCWCGAEDHYCMCTPNVAIDLILVSSTTTTKDTNDIIHDSYLWLVQRKDTNQLAIMGGFVNVDETVEQAVHRELQEEMGIVLDDDETNQSSGAKKKKEPLLRLQGVYSDPQRDNRRRNVSVVFVVKLAHTIHPKAADDAKDVRKISVHDIEQYDFFADHKTILLDYRQSLTGNNKGMASLSTLMNQKEKLTDAQLRDAQLALQIQRSVCT
jgi:8-oxo-dGTP diphosphatase